MKKNSLPKTVKINVPVDPQDFAGLKILARSRKQSVDTLATAVIRRYARAGVKR